MGMRHGVYCLGCCWALMAVLFVVGTMHIGWMATIAVTVLVEKIAPRALRVRYPPAVVLVGWGTSVLLRVGA
jgi:predicted metal-binding membrane protein